MRYLYLSALVLLSACSIFGTAPDTEEAADVSLNLRPAQFQDLPGWGSDNFDNFAQAFNKSCARIYKNPTDRSFSSLKEAGTYGSWQLICQRFQNLVAPNHMSYQKFFEENFRPYQVLADNKKEGLFTGYYEASLRGSRIRTNQYNIPLHARPDDLVMVHLGEFREELKGTRIAGRVQNGTLKPYENREQIVTGQWPHNDKVLVWVDDAVDAFFVQIQGSGAVQISDGNVMRIGYAGQNGHPYYAIGRELVKRGVMDKEAVSMQSIRQWLEQNPAQADEIMNTNKSYVFFRELNTDGPVGGEGVTLTPGRSLAVDHTLLPYGAPMWVDIKPPKRGENGINLLMVAQDTGGAIRGPVRGDVFWGYGERAEYMAGHMKSQGQYWILLPR